MLPSFKKAGLTTWPPLGILRLFSVKHLFFTGCFGWMILMAEYFFGRWWGAMMGQTMETQRSYTTRKAQMRKSESHLDGEIKSSVLRPEHVALREAPPTSSLREMQTPTANQWMELGNSYGRIEGRSTGPKGDRNSTGRPTESPNLDAWGSQRLNHQPRNMYQLDLGLPADM